MPSGLFRILRKVNFSEFKQGTERDPVLMQEKYELKAISTHLADWEKPVTADVKGQPGPSRYNHGTPTTHRPTTTAQCGWAIAPGVFIYVHQPSPACIKHRWKHLVSRGLFHPDLLNLGCFESDSSPNHICVYTLPCWLASVTTISTTNWEPSEILACDLKSSTICCLL